MWRKGDPQALGDCKLAQTLWKTVWRFLRKRRMELPYDSAILLQGIYVNAMKILIGKDSCTPVLTAVLFTIANTWKQPKCPSIDERIKKMWSIHTMEYYMVIKE